MSDQKTINVKSLTSGRVLANNTVLNLIGQLVPMVVGIVTIPILIRHLGTDRFGVITIAWMLIGYFSLFDMGLGRALTQVVAQKLGTTEEKDIPAIFWTSIFLMFVLGVAGALLIASLTPFLVHSVLKIPSVLQVETLNAIYILSVSIPAVILSAALVGFLSAYQRFDIISAIRVPMGAFMFIGPLLVIPFKISLIPVMSVLTIARIVFLIIHLYYCLQTVPKLKERIVLRQSIIRPLFHFGGWMSVSNIISPLMTYFDRFLIGAVISVSAVAYYTTPYEFITKLWIIPASLINVLFPTFAATYTQDIGHAAEVYGRAVKYLLLSLFPIALIVVAVAHQGLTLWLGSSFADNGCRVLQWLTLGVFINSLAQVPFTFLQGIGKPDVTSKLHLIELFIYLPLLWFLLNRYGIEGAAIAWLSRVMIDSVCLFYIAWRCYRPASGVPPAIFYVVFSALMILFVLVMIPVTYLRYGVTVAVMLLFLMFAWNFILSEEEHRYIRSIIRMQRS